MPAWNKGLTRSDPRVEAYVRPKVSPLCRFFAKVKFTDTCWFWTAHCDDEGYGRLWVDGTMALAHVFIYEVFFGPVPDGKELDHTCRNRNCVNPFDVEPVTHPENIRRGNSGLPQRLRTHCPQGHPYDSANTYIDPIGRRVCRICHSRRTNEYHKRIRREYACPG